MADFCVNCGAELKPGAKFCSGCGQKTQTNEQVQDLQRMPKKEIEHQEVITYNQPKNNDYKPFEPDGNQDKPVITVEQKNYISKVIISFLLLFLCYIPGFIYGLVQFIDAESNRRHCGGKTPPGYYGLIVVTFGPIVLGIVLFILSIIFPLLTLPLINQ